MAGVSPQTTESRNDNSMATTTSLPPSYQAGPGLDIERVVRIHTSVIDLPFI